MFVKQGRITATALPDHACVLISLRRDSLGNTSKRSGGLAMQANTLFCGARVEEMPCTGAPPGCVVSCAFVLTTITNVEGLHRRTSEPRCVQAAS